MQALAQKLEFHLVRATKAIAMTIGHLKLQWCRRLRWYLTASKHWKNFRRYDANAANQGARLVVFPEAFVSGIREVWILERSSGSRTDEGREDFRRYWESSVDVPGPRWTTFTQAARAHKVLLVVGVIERDGGTLYCSVLFFGPDGNYLGKHRKVMPTASERLVWGFGDGSTLPVFETELGKLGAVICWENYLPLLEQQCTARVLKFIARRPRMRATRGLATVRHIAVEGRCFVLSSNQFNRRKDFPSDYRSIFGDEPGPSYAEVGVASSIHSEISWLAPIRARSDTDCRDRSGANHSR